MNFKNSALIVSTLLISVFSFSGTSLAEGNLISNPSLENASGSAPTDWFKGSYGTNKPVFTYPVDGEGGGKAASVELTSRTSGDAKWYFKDVAVTGSEKYLFEASYKSNIVSDFTIQYKKTGSTAYYYYWLGSPAIAADWAKFSKEFTAPAGATNLTVFMGIAQVGKLTIDNVSLTKLSGTSPAPIPPTSQPSGMVSLDFDDGWTSVYEKAIPILNKAGFKSTQYIITDTIDTDAEYMNSTQIKEILGQGHEIQSHTLSHAHLTQITDTLLKAELEDSRNILKGLNLGSINSISYPYGEYNTAVIAAAKSAGYLYARSVESGYNSNSTDKYILKTQNIVKTTTFATVKKWIDNAVKNKKWLIIVFHEIKDNGTKYSSKPSELQKIVDYLKTNNIKVVTVSQGVKEIYGI